MLRYKTAGRDWLQVILQSDDPNRLLANEIIEIGEK